MDELHYWLALHQALNATPRTIMQLLKKHHSPRQIFDAYAQNPQQLPLTTTQKARLSSINWRAIEDEIKWEKQTHHHIITLNNPHYPKALRYIYDPPSVLYCIGDPTLLSTLQIAIVGSRKPSHTGTCNAKEFAFKLAQAGLTITSGMALGIDGCAHQGALAAHGTTIAVLGCGANIVYPKRHRSLYDHIKDKGVIISEHPLNHGPIAKNFPRRNRIISGLSQATLVVEATLRSGSLTTARFANEQGRDVFAIPGSIHNPQSCGCHHLIKEGAALTEDVQDILDEFNLSIPVETQKIHTIYRKDLDPIDDKLIECLGFETRSVQYLISELGSSAQYVASQLLKLELRGYIKAVPGGYCRVKL